MGMMQLVALLFTLFGHSHTARMLAVLPFPAGSHHQYQSTILQALAERGHEIVEYSAFPPTKSLPNYTHVSIRTDFFEDFKQFTYEEFQIKCADDTPTGFKAGFVEKWDFIFSVCEQAFLHPAFKKLLSSSEHYDLVFVEPSFGQESMVVFGHKFNAPVVSLQSFYAWSVMNRDAGNSLSIATIPQFNSLVATDQMSFVERLSNFIAITSSLYLYYNYHLPRHEKLIRLNYNDPVPSLESMMSNISLYLIYAHPAVEYVRPYSPNIVPVGGIAISPERQQLPQNIKKLMDEATNGVIYMSFGTVIPMHMFPQEILQIFVNVFKQIPQRVIWKINLDSIEGLSQNVHLTKWVPQPGVLAHPNCVLFLTHGGLNSQHEAIHAGVPTVGIPFFGDQYYNIRFMEHQEVGIKLDFKTLSEDTLSTAIHNVISTPKYKENAMRLSKIYKDHPIPMKDLAVYWVEYVLRHRGASHLRPAAALLPWHQLALLDIITTLIAAFICVIVILYLLISKILHLLLPKNKEGKTFKHKKN